MWLSPPSCCEKRLKWGEKAHLVAKIPPKRGILGDFDVQKGCGKARIGRETRGLERGEKRGEYGGGGRVCARGGAMAGVVIAGVVIVVVRKFSGRRNGVWVERSRGGFWRGGHLGGGGCGVSGEIGRQARSMKAGYKRCGGAWRGGNRGRGNLRFKVK